MEFYIIPPNKHLDLMHMGDRYFCLAQFYKQDAAYRDYFLTLRKQQPDDWITLDNGAAENSLIEQEDLIEIVKELMPNEVIAPDYLLDSEKTLGSLYSFAAKMKEEGLLGPVQLFACPQAATEQEYLEVFEEMVNNPDVSTLGLSKITVPYCFADGSVGDINIDTSRQRCVDILVERGLLKKNVHLLGMGDPNEYEHYNRLRDDGVKEMDFIRSSDSCYTVLAAWHGKSFMQGFSDRIPTTEAYYHAQLTREQYLMTSGNAFYLARFNWNNPDRALLSTRMAMRAKGAN